LIVRAQTASHPEGQRGLEQRSAVVPERRRRPAPRPFHADGDGLGAGQRGRLCHDLLEEGAEVERELELLAPSAGARRGACRDALERRRDGREVLVDPCTGRIEPPSRRALREPA
jgi:hypothetical protein